MWPQTLSKVSVVLCFGQIWIVSAHFLYIFNPVSAFRTFICGMLLDDSAYGWEKSPVDSHKPPVSVINGRAVLGNVGAAADWLWGDSVRRVAEKFCVEPSACVQRFKKHRRLFNHITFQQGAVCEWGSEYGHSSALPVNFQVKLG